MSREIRESLLERALAELRAIDPAAHPACHDRLATLVEHLTDGVLSPLVLEAVTNSRRGRR